MEDKLREEVMADLGLGDDYESLSRGDKIKVGKELKRRQEEVPAESETEVEGAEESPASDDNVVRMFFKNSPHTFVWVDDEGKKHQLVATKHVVEFDMNSDIDVAAIAALKSSFQYGTHFHEITSDGGETVSVAQTLKKVQHMSDDQIRALITENDLYRCGLSKHERDREKLIAAVIKLQIKL